jgi:hypothetical protein
MDKWKKRFDPARFKTGPKLMAILGALFDEDWVEPRLCGLKATSDGFLMAQEHGDLGYNHFIGSMDDVKRNLRGAAEVALEEKDVVPFMNWALGKMALGFERYFEPGTYLEQEVDEEVCDG